MFDENSKLFLFFFKSDAPLLQNMSDLLKAINLHVNLAGSINKQTFKGLFQQYNIAFTS